jgi:thiamine-phosphate pyrophosphorylase
VAAIGGITEENIDAVLAAGADMVCVISAVVAADDPRAAARRLAARIAAYQAER